MLAYPRGSGSLLKYQDEIRVHFGFVAGKARDGLKTTEMLPTGGRQHGAGIGRCRYWGVLRRPPGPTSEAKAFVYLGGGEGPSPGVRAIRRPEPGLDGGPRPVDRRGRAGTGLSTSKDRRARDRRTVTPDTVFQLASVSKPAGSTAAAGLCWPPRGAVGRPDRGAHPGVPDEHL